MVHSAWCKGHRSTKISRFSDVFWISTPARELVEFPAWLTSNGVQDSSHCVIYAPPAPPVDGMRFIGREDIPRTMLGKKPSVFLREMTKATSIVMVGGYSKGAGSKEAGSPICRGIFHGFNGLKCRRTRRGYTAMRDIVTSNWQANSVDC